MNCAKCGTPMPPGSEACPDCGLKIRQAPPSAQPQGGAPGGVAIPPMPGQPVPFQDRPGSTGAFAPGVQPPPPDPFAYSASPSDPYAQQVYSSPGEIPPLPPIVAPGGGPLKAKRDSSTRAIYILIGAVILAVAVTGVLYFTVLRRHEPTGPEATVQAFFVDVASGDLQGMKALCTPDGQLTQEQSDGLLSQCGPAGLFKIDNIKTSVSNLTPTSATVTVDDATMSAGGRSKKFSELTIGGLMKFDLVLVNGQWLIAGS